MEQNSRLTREQEIEDLMGVFAVDRRTADALVAREHNQRAGDCVAVTEDGKAIPLPKTLRLKKQPAA